MVATPNLRHLALLLAVLGDIGMGAEALSESTSGGCVATPGFRHRCVRWCGSSRAVVVDTSTPSGSGVTASAWWRRWTAPCTSPRRAAGTTSSSENEITISDSLVLRFPSPVVRERDPIVADQLRRIGVAW